MSEPIQSIAQNNYILHNIDAKKLYVQEPLFTANSGDAVYVGWRPDETVLWSGNIRSDGTTYPASASLSESIENFNYVRVEGYCHNGTQFPWTTTLYTNGAAIYGIGLGQWRDVTKELDMSRFKLDGSTVSAMEGTWIIPSQNWGNTVSNVTKVVGINRKENA